jgi:tRNA (cytosine38-C5)-methyltransferase
LVDTLKKLGYNVLELLLTPLQFGIPNSRLRYYLLAKKAPESFPYLPDPEVVWRHIPGQGSDWIDPRDAKGTDEAEGSSATIRDFMPDNELPTTSPPYITDRVLEKWGRLFDIVLPSSTRTCCFTRGT